MGRCVPPSTEDHLRKIKDCAIRRAIPRIGPLNSSVELTMDELSGAYSPTDGPAGPHRMACPIAGPHTASSDSFVCRIRTQPYSHVGNCVPLVPLAGRWQDRLASMKMSSQRTTPDNGQTRFPFHLVDTVGRLYRSTCETSAGYFPFVRQITK